MILDKRKIQIKYTSIKVIIVIYVKLRKTPNNIKEKDIIELIKPKLNDFKIQNTLNEEKVIEHKNVKDKILKEISILNSNLQIIYENYKKKNISKDDYLKEKTFIHDKKVLLEVG